MNSSEKQAFWNFSHFQTVKNSVFHLSNQCWTRFSICALFLNFENQNFSFVRGRVFMYKRLINAQTNVFQDPTLIRFVDLWRFWSRNHCSFSIAVILKRYKKNYVFELIVSDSFSHQSGMNNNQFILFASYCLTIIIAPFSIENIKTHFLNINSKMSLVYLSEKNYTVIN